MTFKLRKLDERGAAAMELALALPVLVTMIYGIFQLALLYFANAGMQHALGEGARFATVYASTARNINVTTTTTTGGVTTTTTATKSVNFPTEAQVKSRMESELFGESDGDFDVSTPVGGTSNTAVVGLSEWYDLEVKYRRTMNFIFVSGPTVNLTRKKRVYLASSS